MSLFLARAPQSTLDGIDITPDVPILPPSPLGACSPEEIASLVQQLRSKAGVPIIRALPNGTTAEKMLHLDNSGLFLLYSPTVKSMIEACVYIPTIAEVRIDGPSSGKCFASHVATPAKLTLTVALRTGAPSLCFILLEGNQPLWKATLEAVARRAHRIVHAHPLKARMLHLWVNATLSTQIKSTERKADPVEHMYRRTNGLGGESEPQPREKKPTPAPLMLVVGTHRHVCGRFLRFRQSSLDRPPPQRNIATMRYRSSNPKTTCTPPQTTFGSSSTSVMKSGRS
jgi:hypothetical protein